jgi:phospholipid/cholesterol/gamma-HCH transport system ATP-binding protein
MSKSDIGFDILSLFEDGPEPQLDISQDIALRVRNLQVKFRRQHVLKGVNFDVKRGEVLGFVGASGAGKSVLLRTMIGLIQPTSGTIEVFGQEFSRAKELREQLIERHWGILFQHGALFSALTVRQNVQFPMREYLDLSPRLLDEVAAAKLKMVGLPPEALNKMPSELSGGMIKRVALARALALDPASVFLDEPTSGLDPISAGEFDQLILTLQETLGISVFMVTHDLDSLHRTCDRIAVLGEGKIVEAGTMDQMLASQHPWLKSYFHGARAHDDWHVPVKG